MPRVLPSIRMIDALYMPRDGVILLFGTSNTVREAFLSLFYRTFATSRAAADPYHLALSVGLEKNTTTALAQVAPVNWPSRATDKPTLADRPLPPIESEMTEPEATATETTATTAEEVSA